MLDQQAVQKLYTRKLDAYAAFVRFFQSQRGIRTVLERADVIQPDIAVLDAGCGFGLASFALADAMQGNNFSCRRMDAFDLTPAMLARFREHLSSRPGMSVETRQADVMDTDDLPTSWRDYDLVMSMSMLEYLPKRALPQALVNLRQRLADNGRIVVMMTRKTVASKILIEMGWHATSYRRQELVAAFDHAGFTNLHFIRFPLRYGWLNRANHVVVAQHGMQA